MNPTWLPDSRGLSDAELDAIVMLHAGCPGAPSTRADAWFALIREEWHRRALHKRFDDEH
jgi:hypothetical protein